MLLGILFVCSTSQAGTADLPGALFAEDRWTECRREALRVLAEQPGDPWAGLYFHAAGLRGGVRPEDSVSGLAALAETSDEPAVAAAAHYELGLEAWARRDAETAWHHLTAAFSFHGNETLYKAAGCMLFMLSRDHPELVTEDNRFLVNQLLTLRPLWTRDRIDAALHYREMREQRDAVTGKPGQWIVSFYRAQIGPAIGARCSLHPSCSEYFLQASREHGLAGIPLIADRLVREPGLVSRAEHTVFINGREKIADPLEDHVR